MLAKCLQILLTAMILACPFRCDSQAALNMPQSESSACCEKCAARCEQQSPLEAPADRPSEQPSDDCQCICAGALFKDSSQYELLMQSEFSADLDSTLGDCLIAALPDLDRPLTPDRLPDERMAHSGRSICCRHMSFLC